MSSTSDSSDPAARFLEDAVEGPALPAHVYFHIPFCASKCAYCDFYSVSSAEGSLVTAVFAGLRAEVHRWATACLPGVVESIYVGGGTPSLHSAEVARLIAWTAEQLPLRAGAEITVEANPDSLSAEGLRRLQNAGANRVSVGVQSFDDEVLRLLGRRHDAEAALDACRMVTSAGLELSLDLICGVKAGEGAAVAWQRTLYEAAGTQARHVSVYPLQVETDTPMASAIAAGEVTLPDEDQVADELEYGAEWLARAGLPRYEVANYAAPGHESVHNTAYWLGHPYLGIGPGAHGMLDGITASTVGITVPGSLASDGRVRYAAPRSIAAWLTGESQTVEVLSPRQALTEDVMLGLRLVRGVPADQVARAELTPVLESLAEDGLVELEDAGRGPRWRTTQRGWLLGNEVFGRVWNASVDEGDAATSA